MTWVEKVWRHDLRINEHLALKSFVYNDLIRRHNVNLDIFWLKDESSEDSANFPSPNIIAAEIVEDLQAALEQFSELQGNLAEKKR